MTTDQITDEGKAQALSLVLGFPALFTTLVPWLFQNVARLDRGQGYAFAALVFASFVAVYFIFPLGFVALQGLRMGIWRRCAVVVLSCLLSVLVSGIYYFGPAWWVVVALIADVLFLWFLFRNWKPKSDDSGDSDVFTVVSPAGAADAYAAAPTRGDSVTANGTTVADSGAAGGGLLDLSLDSDTSQTDPGLAMVPDSSPPPGGSGSSTGKLGERARKGARRVYRVVEQSPRYAFPALLLAPVAAILWLWLFPPSTLSDFKGGFALSPVVHRAGRQLDDARENWLREVAVIRLASDDSRPTAPRPGSAETPFSLAARLVRESRAHRDSMRAMLEVPVGAQRGVGRRLVAHDSASTARLGLLISALNPDAAPLGLALDSVDRLARRGSDAGERSNAKTAAGIASGTAATAERGPTAERTEVGAGSQVADAQLRYANRRVQSVLYLSDIYDIKTKFARNHLARLYNSVRFRALFIVTASVALLLVAFFYEFGPGSTSTALPRSASEDSQIRRNSYQLGFAVLLFMLIPLVKPIKPEDIDPAHPLDAFTLAQWHLPSFVSATVTGTDTYRYTNTSLERLRELEQLRATNNVERTNNTIVLVDTVPAHDTVRIVSEDTIIDPELRARVETLSNNVAAYKHTVDSVGTVLQRRVGAVLTELRDSAGSNQ
ncbi:MAG TPA: hypothetical protein VF092_02220 [Longimicrobium sp.]